MPPTGLVTGFTTLCMAYTLINATLATYRVILMKRLLVQFKKSFPYAYESLTENGRHRYKLLSRLLKMDPMVQTNDIIMVYVGKIKAATNLMLITIFVFMPFIILYGYITLKRW